MAQRTPKRTAYTANPRRHTAQPQSLTSLLNGMSVAPNGVLMSGVPSSGSPQYSPHASPLQRSKNAQWNNSGMPVFHSSNTPARYPSGPMVPLSMPHPDSPYHGQYVSDAPRIWVETSSGAMPLTLASEYERTYTASTTLSSSSAASTPLSSCSSPLSVDAPSSTPGTRTLHLRVIFPIPYNPTIDAWFQNYYPSMMRPNVVLDFGYLDSSAPVGFITSDYANAVNIPYIIKACQKAQMDGCDGVLIDIAFDTGMDISKHVCDIPVVGALQSAVGVAQSVCGNKFSILSISNNEVPVDYRIAREYRFCDMLASVRPINVAVLDLQKDFEKLVSAAYEQATLAIAEDGADTIVLGCTGMVGLAARLSKMLGDRIPVLDGCQIGLYNLEDLVRLNLRQSKQWFDTPDELIPLSVKEAARYPVVPLQNGISVTEHHTPVQHPVALTARASQQAFHPQAKPLACVNPSAWACNPQPAANDPGASTVFVPRANVPTHTSTGIPVKKMLSLQDVQDILAGATFFGSGGGGKVATSMAILQSAIKPDSQIALIDVDSLSDNDYGIVTADIGEPSQPIDLYGYAYTAAAEAMELALSSTPATPKATFVSPCETGCLSFIVPLVTALQKGLPIIDADGGGRAVPQMEQLTFACNMNVGPIGMSNTDPKKSFRCALQTFGESNAESIIRPILANPLIEGNLAIAMWGGNGPEYKKVVIRNTLSRCLAWGQAMRECPPANVLSTCLSQCGGKLLFSGYLVASVNNASGGFDYGQTSFSNTMGGTKQFYVMNKNENMLAFSSSSSSPVCMAPDLISFMDANGVPLTNAELPDYAFTGADGQPGPKRNVMVHVIASAAADAMWSRSDIVSSFQQVFQNTFCYVGPMIRLTDNDTKQ